MRGQIGLQIIIILNKLINNNVADFTEPSKQQDAMLIEAVSLVISEYLDFKLTVLRIKDMFGKKL